MEETGTYFGVFEFGNDPSIVTKIMGIAPSRSWVKGASIPGKSKGVRTHSRWELKSPDTTSDFNEQIKALLILLEGYRTQILNIKQKFKAGICCYGYYDEEYNPELHLSENTIQQLANFGLSVDFDIYFLGKNI